MKTVTIPAQAAEIISLLDQAREEDVLVRTADGTEYLVTIVDEFDAEVARTRQNARLMALLDERARQSETIPLDEVKRQLGFGGE
ncbi:MAG: hypothetical protein HYX69_17410 [Planctomycetia bacterium]|nr:hypothetical protein [Planctomycetia bacterium]